MYNTNVDGWMSGL